MTSSNTFGQSMAKMKMKHKEVSSLCFYLSSIDLSIFSLLSFLTFLFAFFSLFFFFVNNEIEFLFELLFYFLIAASNETQERRIKQNCFFSFLDYDIKWKRKNNQKQPEIE
jgi:hypothetical protein